MLGIIGYATLPLPLFSHAQAIVVCTTTQQSWIHSLGYEYHRIQRRFQTFLVAVPWLQSAKTQHQHPQTYYYPWIVEQ